MGEVIGFPRPASVVRKPRTESAAVSLLFTANVPAMRKVPAGSYVRTHEFDDPTYVVIGAYGTILYALDLGSRITREISWHDQCEIIEPRDVRARVYGLCAVTLERDPQSGVIQLEHHWPDGSIAEVLLDYGNERREWHPFERIIITGRAPKNRLWPRP